MVSGEILFSSTLRIINVKSNNNDEKICSDQWRQQRVLAKPTWFFDEQVANGKTLQNFLNDLIASESHGNLTAALLADFVSMQTTSK